ncbi:MAG: superoxide dismutase [Cu-Zn] SodC [Saezia sp.]
MVSLLKKTVVLTGFVLTSACAFAQAGNVVNVNFVDENGVGQAIGTVTLTDSEYGLVLTPDLKGLPAGNHGFHIHANPSCGPDGADNKKGPALAAGGHFDPDNTGKHGTPWGGGHKGDLPALYVGADGVANYPVLAPRLKVADVMNRSIMVHVGGENHADQPALLGGGGPRMACGVIK